jgi:hypothetical protein
MFDSNSQNRFIPFAFLAGSFAYGAILTFGFDLQAQRSAAHHNGPQ